MSSKRTNDHGRELQRSSDSNPPYSHPSRRAGKQSCCCHLVFLLPLHLADAAVVDAAAAPCCCCTPAVPMLALMLMMVMVLLHLCHVPYVCR
jgi:hypothetical protein